MNATLTNQLILMSKAVFYGIVIHCCLAVSLIASDLKGQKQTLDQVFLSIHASETSLQAVLGEIEQKTGFHFSYYSNHIKKKNITIDVADQSLMAVLKDIADQTKLSFKRINKNINVLEIDAERSVQDMATESEDIGVSGKITDEKGEGLPGASVVVKGTSTGTTTDLDGKYKINVPEESIIVISFVGYKTSEILVGNQTVIDVKMQLDAEQLEEVVVIGYGTQKKSDLTGAVGQVSAEKLQERPVSSLNQGLSGRVAGVSVSQNSGEPGGRTKVRIRGQTSISLNNTPLYVVDGIIMPQENLGNGTSPVDYINSNDILSVEVLKDASATAIYGARGANGVILVTTRRGSKTGPQVTYDNFFGVGKLRKKMGVLTSEQFLEIEEIAYQNAEKFDPVGWANNKYVDPVTKRTDPRLFDSSGNPIYNTDWQDEVTRNAFQQNHQLGLTGGNENGSFGAYLGYQGEDGLMKISFLKRYSARLVFDSKVNDWFSAGGSLSYNLQKERKIHGSWIGRNMLEYLPFLPVKHEDGSWANNGDYPGMEGGPNPVRVGEEYLDFWDTQTMIGDLFANIRITDDLVLRTQVGVNTIGQKTSLYAGRDLRFISSNQNGYAQLGQTHSMSWQFENYLTYSKTFDEIHNIKAMFGLSWQHTDNSSFSTRTDSYSDDFFRFNNLAAGAVVQTPSSSASAYGFNSYFGRLEYSLMNKYYVTITGRRDGSSKFGADQRYAFFPSAAVAWKISEEDFLAGSSTISNLKLRASYGETGNSGIAAYQANANLSTNSYLFDGALATGIGIGSLANPLLAWEETHMVDMGLELGLFKGRIQLNADIYRKTTVDMLLNQPVPRSSGYGSVANNIGDMRNEGFELALNTVNIENDDFSWETLFNWSINKNEVTKLTGGADIIQNGVTIIREGEPLNSFYAWISLGTYGTDEEDLAEQYNRLPGDIKRADLNEDGVLNGDDRTIIGNGLPKGYGTFSNTVRYKGFDMTLDLQFQYGHDIMFLTTRPQENRQGIANSLSTVLDAWTPQNQDTEIAQYRPIAAGYDNLNTSHMIQDASFIRGRNLTFGYNFSPDVLDKISLSRLRVYSSIQNFFVIDDYQGFDPEAQTQGNEFGQGLVNFQHYPRPTVFLLGLNATF